MPTAILDLDIQYLPLEITGLDRYSKALVLIRFNNKPVGQITLPVIDGRISGGELHHALVEAGGWNLWERWLHEYLDWDETAISGYIPPKATVAVCTRDRPEDLKRCLDALMRLPDDGQEILVIDNCPSTDDAQRLVESYKQVRYVREDRPGSSAARNRALREAQHEIVAFTDDDATPDPAWLRALLQNFDDSQVLCVTGLVMPLELETEAQEWFECYSPHGRGFQRTVFDGAYVDPLHVAQVGVSANMALRRDIIESLETFDNALGAGTPSRGGEDYDLFSRILASGYKIIYEPKALVWHRHRRTWQELRKTLNGYGIAVYAFWTRALLIEREFGVLLHALGWLVYKQLPNLFHALLRKPNTVPLDLLLAELSGCAVGPWFYFYSRCCLQARSIKS